jgi:hypothetical protein
MPATQQPAAPAPSAEQAASEPAAEPEPEVQAIAQECARLCQRVAQNCKEMEVLTCRGRCTRYVKRSAGCEEQVRKALSCHTEAKDANVCDSFAAESCYQAFAEVRACQRGESPPVEGVPSQLPPGWRIIVDDDLDFEIALPANAQVDTRERFRTWSGKEGKVTYYVTSVPPPSGDTTDARLFRMALEHLGVDCQRGFKIKGRFDSKGVTGARYQTECKDGSTRRGSLRIRRDVALVIGSRGAPPDQRVWDRFESTFEFHGP